MTKYIDGFAEDENKPDVVVIDEQTEQLDKIRNTYRNVPLIVLTAKDYAAADNLNLVLHKPFSLWKLLDTIRAANNKLDNSAEGRLVFNRYELHPNARKIIDLVSGEETKLTEKEVTILKYLYKTPDDYVSKNDLQTNVWQYNEEVATHTIETHIYRLRQKVEKDNGRRLILIDNGKYKLNMEE